MENTITTFVQTLIFGDKASKIDGRRNWMVRVEANNNHVYAGTMRAMKNWGLTSEMIKYIVKYGIAWSMFTYKKDYIEYLNALKNAGFEIKIVS